MRFSAIFTALFLLMPALKSTAASTAKIETALPALPPGTRITVLDNGLTIIVREDHSAPVVSAQSGDLGCLASLRQGCSEEV
mgnify:CR=1 FL=1